MKKTIIIILTLIYVLSFGQNDDKLKGKPKTLEETFQYLDQMMGDTTKYNFMLLPEDIAAGRLHFSFGMWIRNEWGLWKNSELKEYFMDKGVYHPDEMSRIIFVSYHRFLHNQPVDLNEQLQITFQEQLDGGTTLEQLLRFYPIGDTVLTTLSGKKGLFRKYVTFKGLAIIKGYEGNKLILKLIKLYKSDKIKTNYKLGDEIDARIASCTLIPPKNWKKNEAHTANKKHSAFGN